MGGRGGPDSFSLSLSLAHRREERREKVKDEREPSRRTATTTTTKRRRRRRRKKMEAKVEKINEKASRPPSRRHCRRRCRPPASTASGSTCCFGGRTKPTKRRRCFSLFVCFFVFFRVPYACFHRSLSPVGLSATQTSSRSLRNKRGCSVFFSCSRWRWSKSTCDPPPPNPRAPLWPGQPSVVIGSFFFSRTFSCRWCCWWWWWWWWWRGAT